MVGDRLIHVLGRKGDMWYSLSGGQLEGVGDTAFFMRIERSRPLGKYMHPFLFQ